jgi:hypothetical protein
MKFRRLVLLIVSMCLLCSACTSGDIQPGTGVFDTTSDTEMSIAESPAASTSSSINIEGGTTATELGNEKEVISVVFVNRINGYGSNSVYPKGSENKTIRAYEKTDDPEQLFGFTAFLYPVPAESATIAEGYERWPEICDEWGVIQYDNYGYEPEYLYFLATLDQVEAIVGKTILGYAVQIYPLYSPFIHEKAAELLEKLDPEVCDTSTYDIIRDELFIGPKQIEVEIEVPVHDLERAGKK